MWKRCTKCLNMNPMENNECSNCHASFDIKVEQLKVEEKSVAEKVIEQRIEDFVEDLEDDGKRNYSNRKPKSSKKERSKSTGRFVKTSLKE